MTTSDIHGDAINADPKAGPADCCGSCSDTATTATTAAAGASEQPEENHAMTTATYTVTGMTCGHCVNAVSSEIGKLPGVSDVQVDLPTGAVTVTSAAPLARAQVAGAVEEAGYDLTATGTGTGTGAGAEGERI